MPESLRTRVVEAGADAMEALPYDTIELRNWGESSVADPARVLTTAALDAMLDCLTENADEWWQVAKTLPQFEHGGPTMEHRLIEALREHR